MTAETYVNQIVKKVKCPKQKRSEIAKQLLAESYTELEQGENLERIMLRMGEPIAVAEEFNQNLPEEEHRKYKRGKAMKIAGVIIAVLAVLTAAAAWFVPVVRDFGTSGLFEEAAVEQRSREVIQMLDEGNYEALQACSDKMLHAILNEAAMEMVKSLSAKDWGAFQGYGKFYLAEQTQQGKTRAVVQMNASYEKVAVTYTLFFDEDLTLSGLYIK